MNNIKIFGNYQLQYNDNEFTVVHNKKNIVKSYDYMKELDVICNNWNDIEVYESINYDYYICLFNDNNNWYLVYKYEIIDIKNETNVVLNNFKNLVDNYNFLDANLCYHYIMNNKNNLLLFMFTTIKYSLMFGKIKNTITFYNYENFLLAIDKINYYSITNKNINKNGFIVKINNVFYVMYTNIYKFIMKMLPKHKNQYLNFLELYQTNKLYTILPYVHKYSLDVFNRIHNSFKLIARELVNIYHTTRNKKNIYVLENLPKTYKNVISDLHDVYIKNKLQNNEISIKYGYVYNYIKRIDPNILRQFFFDRKILIEKLIKIGFNINGVLYIDSKEHIDLITQTELLS
jgi:hypothetical protein